MFKKRTLRQKQELWAFSFLAIPLFFFVVVRFFPAFYSFNVSLRDWSMLSLEKPFVGLGNFRDLASDEVFWKALRNTFKYVFLGVPIQIVVGLAIALMLHNIRRFVPLFRTLYFVPYITSVVAVA